MAYRDQIQPVLDRIASLENELSEYEEVENTYEKNPKYSEKDALQTAIERMEYLERRLRKIRFVSSINSTNFVTDNTLKDRQYRELYTKDSTSPLIYQNYSVSKSEPPKKMRRNIRESFVLGALLPALVFFGLSFIPIVLCISIITILRCG